jgi:4-hydroxybenzoate polyprenyltransferase
LDNSRWKALVLLLADRLFLLRPLVIVPALTFFLLGYNEAVLRVQGDQVRSPWSGLLWYALLMASVYVANQLADVESDRANQKLFLMPSGMISKREAVLAAAVLAILAFLGSARLGPTTVVLFALSFTLGLAYSIPPVALKRRFPFDLLSNAAGYGILAFVTGWSLAREPRADAVVTAIPFAFCVGAVFILTALADREGDARSGFRTTGVVLSLKQGVTLALVLVAVVVPLGVAVDNRISIVGAIVTGPFFVYAYVKRDTRSVSVAYRVASAIFVLIVGVLYPAFLFVVLVLLALARLYYYMRFSVDYPTIAGR